MRHRRDTLLILICLHLSLCGLHAADITIGPTDRIQDAINDANDGDRIILSQGTYQGVGNRDLDFSFVADKSLTIMSSDPSDGNVVAATIIDCQGSAQETHRAFSFDDGETENIVIDGLTIINGYHNFGGAVRISGATPVIRNCVFSNNFATEGGGAIYCENNGNATLVSCTFSDNITQNSNGGALASIGSDLDITLCLFLTNQSDKDINLGASTPQGGGLFFSDGVSFMDRCEVIDNRGIFGGGIGLNDTANLNITNSLIVGNQSGADNPNGGGGGGGFYLAGESILNATNCTIADNQTFVFGGGGIRSFDLSVITLSNCIVWGNQSQAFQGGNQVFLVDSSLDVSYTDMRRQQPEELGIDDGVDDQSTIDLGQGNLELDPLFANPGDFENEAWRTGYQLTGATPCRNAGSNALIDGFFFDLVGASRVINNVVDMGAFESAAIDGPDLAGPEQFLPLETGSILIPGDRLKLSYEVRNLGNEQTRGAVRVNAYASTDTSLETATDTFLGQGKASVTLKEGQSRNQRIVLTVPAGLVPGNYYLLLLLDAEDDLAETNEVANNLIVSDEAYELRWEFGRPPERTRPVRLTVTNPTSPEVPVAFTLTNGVGTITPDFSTLTLSGTTDRDSLTISTRGRGVTTTIGNILIAQGSLRQINAKTTNLVNGSLSVPNGLVGTLFAANLTEYSIDMAGQPTDSIMLRFLVAQGLEIDTGAGIRQLQAKQWLAGTQPGGVSDEINAAAIRVLQISGDRRSALPGDFEADLLLTGSGDERTPILTTAKIAGAVRNSLWNLSDSANNIFIGQLDNALIFMGVNETYQSIADFQNTAADFVTGEHTIKSVTLTGIDGVFFINNSVLAGSDIGSINFRGDSNGTGLVQFAQSKRGVQRLPNGVTLVDLSQP